MLYGVESKNAKTKQRARVVTVCYNWRRFVIVIIELKPVSSFVSWSENQQKIELLIIWANGFEQLN